MHEHKNTSGRTVYTQVPKATHKHTYQVHICKAITQFFFNICHKAFDRGLLQHFHHNYVGISIHDS